MSDIAIGQEDVDFCFADISKLKGIVHEIVEWLLQELVQSRIALDLTPSDRMLLGIKADLYIILFAMVVNRFDFLNGHFLIENVAIYNLGLRR